MIGLSYLVKDSAWWVVVLVAYCVGAFFNHALFVMIHECSHHLLFKNKAMNRLAAIVSNMPHVFPSAISFERYHIKHHSFQGVHELDADLPDFWEAKLFNNSVLGKGFWLLLFPVFQVIRTFRLKEIRPVDGWIVTNWIIQIAFNAARRRSRKRIRDVGIGPRDRHSGSFYTPCIRGRNRSPAARRCPP